MCPMYNNIMCVHGYSKSKRRDVYWVRYVIPTNLVCVFFGTAIPTSSFNFIQLLFILVTVLFYSKPI